MERETITREEFDRRLEQSTIQMRQKNTLLEAQATELEDLIQRKHNEKVNKAKLISELDQRLATTRFLRSNLYDLSFDQKRIKSLVDALEKSGFYVATGFEAEQRMQETCKSGDVYWYSQREIMVDFEDIYEGTVEYIAEKANARTSSLQIPEKLQIAKRGKRCYSFLGNQEVMIFDYDEVEDNPLGMGRWLYVTNKIVNFINLFLEYSGSKERIFYDCSEMGVFLSEEEAEMLQAYHYMPTEEDLTQ